MAEAMEVGSPGRSIEFLYQVLITTGYSIMA